MHYRNLDFLFFDLDRTLIDHDQAEERAVREFYRKHREQIALDPDEVFDYWEKISEEYWERYSNEELGYHEQRLERLRTFLNFTDEDISDEELNELFKEYLSIYRDACELFPEVRNTFQQLPDNPRGIITNGGKEIQHEKLQKTNIFDWFSVIVCSNEVQNPKPHPSIFHEALQRAGKEPGQCLYLGDHYEHDIVPAKEQGLHVIWINRDGIEPETDIDEDLDVISSLDELPELL